ncbi:MAG: hypothetical protein PHF00_04290, partial [Elusimicrobia bacterium]|nr:hypothetical protein [Elusimicrobiota bacterium]
FFFGGDSKIFSRDAYFFASISSFLEDKESVLATNLSQEELADLIRPSIVRIVHQVKGEVKIPFAAFGAHAFNAALWLFWLWPSRRPARA